MIIFFCGVITTKKTMTSCWHCFLFWWCCNKEKDDNVAMRHCLLLWWCCNDKGDKNLLLSPSSMALLQKNAIIIAIALFSGFAIKKVTTTLPSPSSMVVVLPLPFIFYSFPSSLV
jgi:hypothetical protein